MSGPHVDYDEAMRAMAQRNESIRSSWKAPRISPVQSTRRHSARIEKSRSHHPSPRTPERRRLTSSTRHYSAMEDHYRRMMGIEDDDDEQSHEPAQQYSPPMRPVSWHPGSSTSHDMYAHAYTAEPSPTSQYLSYQNSPFNQAMGPVPTSQSAWSSYMHGDFHSAMEQHIQQDLTSWFDNGTSQSNSRITSAWTESNEDEEERRKQREPSVELIGLGLYDEPGFTVKIGSKLEEECDPPEFDDEDDEEEESEEEEELPKPEEAKVVQASLPLDMSGRSFFVGPHEALESTWWPSHEAKQPHATVSSVNYGWI